MKGQRDEAGCVFAQSLLRFAYFPLFTPPDRVRFVNCVVSLCVLI